MRRNAIIGTVLAATLGGIGGLGTNAALALDSETACSTVAGMTVCALNEINDSAPRANQIAYADTGLAAVLVAQGEFDNNTPVDSSDGDTDQVTLVAASGPATGVIVYHSNDGQGESRTLAAVEAYDNAGNRTGTGGDWYSNSDNPSASYMYGGFYQQDEDGYRLVGFTSEEDACFMSFGNPHLLECPVMLGVPSGMWGIPFVNLP